MGREGMGALRRLSVALYNGNDFLFLANLHAFCRAAGKHLAIGFVVTHTIVKALPVPPPFPW